MSEVYEAAEEYRRAHTLQRLPHQRENFAEIQTDADGYEFGMLQGVAIPLNTRKVRNSARFLEEVGVAVSALPAGIMRGVARTLVNIGASAGLVEQKEVDRFFGDLKEVGSTDGNVPAKVAGFVGEMAGAFVLPVMAGARALQLGAQAIQSRNKILAGLRRYGANPFISSLVADGIVGGLGISPNEENIANLIFNDANSPLGVAMQELLAIDPDDSEWTNRARNVGEVAVIGGLAESVVASIKRLPDLVRQAKKFVATEEGAALSALAATHLSPDTE